MRKVLSHALVHASLSESLFLLYPISLAGQLYGPRMRYCAQALPKKCFDTIL